MSNIKDQYTRKNIKSDILKLIFMRLDISGVVKFDDFVEKLSVSEYVKKAFKKIKYLPKLQPSYIQQSYHPKNGTLPISRAASSDVYRFIDCTLEESSNAFLDVTKDGIMLNILCDGAYSGSERYTKFMVDVVRTLLDVNFDSYISLERVGIRKIDFFDAKNKSEVSAVFDENFVVKKELDILDQFKESTKTSIYCEDNVMYNVVQHIAKKDDGQIKVVFDVDSYVVYEDPLEGESMNPDQLFELMYVKMQNKMFEFFKDVTTVSYLQHCKG